MSLSNIKALKNQKYYNKENLQLNSNTNHQQNIPHKQSIKTGQQIKNKLKAKNLFKTNLSNKKAQIKKNSHISQKNNRKIFPSKNIIDKNKSINKLHNKDQCNLSSSSSVRSIKSVTFSIDSNISDDRSLSQSSTGLRKKSILKNKLSTDKSNLNSDKKSLASSNCSHLRSVDQAVQNPNSNNIIFHKYQRLLKELKMNGQKYTDTIYPPCEESAFLRNAYSKQFIQTLNNEGYRIKWVRLTELYSDKQICLWHPEAKSVITKGFIHSSGRQNNYIPTVFNCINKSYLMQKYFENQKISNQGIYYVKIHQTQTNIWKYVIIDDYIPVIISMKKNQSSKIIKPAFLNVQTEHNIVELWPYLLQKAFAKYYSTYDSLIKGNTLDFLQQVTGQYFITHDLKLNQTQQLNRLTKNNIQNLLGNPYNMMIAQTNDGLIYPIKSVSNQIQIMDIQNNYKLQNIGKQHFYNYFDKVHIIQAKKYANQINCLIKQQHLLQKQKQFPQNKRLFILRSFTLQQASQCILALTQKQQRFHRSVKSSKNKNIYTYSWMRIILVMKQSTGYRWINGQYDRKKILKIQIDLQPGEYFVIIIPQWNTKPYDLKLSLYSNTQTVIQRKPYQNHTRIIEQSCMDLAQRYGRLIQINNNICSYNYIDYKVGFIIENINNEKSSGEVKILRTIDGLENYNISPINNEFQQEKKLQIKIPSLQSYTVVLKVSGGVDKTFLQQFDFGI